MVDITASARSAHSCYEAAYYAYLVFCLRLQAHWLIFDWRRLIPPRHAHPACLPTPQRSRHAIDFTALAASPLAQPGSPVRQYLRHRPRDARRRPLLPDLVPAPPKRNLLLAIMNSSSDDDERGLSEGLGRRKTCTTSEDAWFAIESPTEIDQISRAVRSPEVLSMHTRDNSVGRCYLQLPQ